MSSYLGETATNLSNLFAFASTGSYVLFLDEFDSLGKMRGDVSDHGELRRVVNAVLQQIDAYTGPSLIVAATNHSQILDAALWRRFDAVIELGLPSADETRELLRRLLSADGFALAQQYVDRFEGLPHAAVEYFANSAARHSLLEKNKGIRQADIDFALRETVERPW
ncbi:hypothetical protein A4X16_15515 [Microbacterium sp. H83]|nr:hypothetical protein A4X16_15515 [Microbacterium sp. H83]